MGYFQKHPGSSQEAIRQLSNEQKPGCLEYIGYEILHLYGDCFINNDIRIPFLTNQDFNVSFVRR